MKPQLYVNANSNHKFTVARSIHSYEVMKCCIIITYENPVCQSVKFITRYTFQVTTNNLNFKAHVLNVVLITSNDFLINS